MQNAIFSSYSTYDFPRSILCVCGGRDLEESNTGSSDTNIGLQVSGHKRPDLGLFHSGGFTF